MFPFLTLPVSKREIVGATKMRITEGGREIEPMYELPAEGVNAILLLLAPV